MSEAPAFYNEIDPFAAAWLRELIKAGHIAPGVVDERDIRDVRPDELAGFAQCHFFAGIGVWSYALRRAGWADDRPIWTASCPCQPFSSAGAGNGFDDERHLWPAFHWLVAQRRPVVIAGEQVASKHADAWLDLVQADVEGMGYAFGCVPFPSAGVGAPHIRDRAYWLAHAERPGLEGHGRHVEQHGSSGWQKPVGYGASSGDARSLAYADGGHASAERQQPSGQYRQLAEDCRALRLADPVRDGARNASGQGLGTQAEADGSDGRVPGQRLRPGLESAPLRLADADCDDAAQVIEGDEPINQQWPAQRRGAVEPSWAGAGSRVRGGAHSGGRSALRPSGSVAGVARLGPTNGFWYDADWLGCTDGKWRPVEPGTFPLAHGASARVGRLRGYGNAINAQAAKAFIQAVMEHLAESEETDPLRTNPLGADNEAGEVTRPHLASRSGRV